MSVTHGEDRYKSEFPPRTGLSGIACCPVTDVEGRPGNDLQRCDEVVLGADDTAARVDDAFIDDHSRAIVGHRWGFSEDSVRLAAALRPALAARGVPDGIYHSTPGRPQGRGKIERFFRTVRDQFLVELAGGTIGDLNTLNRHFTSWVEAVYHRRDPVG